MKRFKSLLSMLAAAVLLVLLPGSDALTAKADEPATYAIKYVGGNINDWRYQPGSTFDDSAYHREIYTLLVLDLKEGDNVVVYSDGDVGKILDLGDIRLGSLTIHQNTTAIVHTGGVQDCYALAGSYCSVSGDVTNAYLYDKLSCTFTGNVSQITLYGTDGVTSNVSCGGTVGRFYAPSTTLQRTFFDFRNVSEGQLNIANGVSQTPAWAYTNALAADFVTPEGAPAPGAPAQAETTPAPAAPEASASAAAQAPAPAPTFPSNNDEYDAVPKTGQSNPYPILIGISAVCFAGSFLLKRKEQKSR